MSLVIDLKPNEKVVIGNAVITNHSSRTRLHIEGDAPILREKDIMREEDVDTPCKRIYFMVQLMYLSPLPDQLHAAYFEQIRAIQEAAPSTALYFMAINDHILNGHYFKALREARNLMEYEKEIMPNV